MIKTLNEIRDIQSMIGGDEGIYVYGAGRVSAAFMLTVSNQYNELMDRIERIIVSNKSLNPDYVMGIRVDAACSIIDKPIGYLVIATLESSHESIIRFLSRCNVKEVFLISDKLYKDMCKAGGDFEIDIVSNNQLYRNELNNQIAFIGQEIIWGMNFNNAIAESKWCLKRDFAPVGMAVGYYYLYILYRALDSGRFNSFLDVGMGQTSKMFSQYLQFNRDTNLVIVESDPGWIEFFKHNIDMEKAEILGLDCEIEKTELGSVRIYKDFEQTLKDRKFDIISIDGPFGGDMRDWSRIDILSILPDCLKESWMILYDDISRAGEMNTFNRILEILDMSGIPHSYAIHHGKNSFGIITSTDNRFFCKV